MLFQTTVWRFLRKDKRKTLKVKMIKKVLHYKFEYSRYLKSVKIQGQFINEKKLKYFF